MCLWKWLQDFLFTLKSFDLPLVIDAMVKKFTQLYRKLALLSLPGQFKWFDIQCKEKGWYIILQRLSYGLPQPKSIRYKMIRTEREKQLRVIHSREHAEQFLETFWKINALHVINVTIHMLSSHAGLLTYLGGEPKHTQKKFSGLGFILSSWRMHDCEHTCF